MSANLVSEFPLAAVFRFSNKCVSIRPSMQPTVKTVILYEEQNIALRSSRHDGSPLNTDENHGDVVLEAHFATQNNNAGYVNTERNYLHHCGADPAKEPVQNTKGSINSMRVSLVLLHSYNNSHRRKGQVTRLGHPKDARPC